MLYSLITLKTEMVATIRRSDHGLSEDEFTCGARILRYAERNTRGLHLIAEDHLYEVIPPDEWKKVISNTLGVDLQPDFFIDSNPRKDKWDTRPEIY